MPKSFETIFSKTQRSRLASFLNGPGLREASNDTLLLLERKGFVRRLAGPFLSKWGSHIVIEWEITAEGRAKLLDDEARSSA